MKFWRLAEAAFVKISRSDGDGQVARLAHDREVLGSVPAPYFFHEREHAVVKSIVVSTIRENRIKIIFYVLPGDKTGFYEFSVGSKRA